MNALDGSLKGDTDKNPDGLDELLGGTRIDLLENKVTLAVPEGNPKGIKSFDDLAEKLKSGDVLLAIGNSDVPVGQYTQKIFAHYGLDEAALASSGVLTYGSNVKEVTTQVSEGTVDCGITTQPTHSRQVSTRLTRQLLTCAVRLSIRQPCSRTARTQTRRRRSLTI